ncbi:MAG: YfhO family protein [Candidatus Eisenbacteria bacterium]|nr:YfhO family protein [Candidatus Eisenbacteria bacterium]
MAKEKARKPATRAARTPDIPARNWFDFHPRTTVALVLLALALVFYHSLVFEGMTFGSPDTYAPASFSRIGLESIEKRHVYPLWNPFVFCGMPSFASLAFNPYIYPPDWPLALIDKVVPLPDNLIVLLYSYLAGLFMALLLLELGLPIMSSLWGAVVFAYTPNFIAMGAYGHGSKVATVAFLPLVLWLAERLFKRWRVQDLGWLAMALGFQMLRAHVQIVYYTGMMMGLYYLVHAFSLIKAGARATKILRDGAGLAVAYALGFGLAAFLLLPVKDYQKHSVRGAGEGGGAKIEYATRWSFGPSEISTFLVPSAAGFGGPTYVGSVKPFTDYPNYMGLLALFLAGAGFLFVRDRIGVFALLLGLGALLISFGEYFKPLYLFLFQHLPFFNAFRVPVMILILLQFAVALLSARGIYALLGRLTVADPKGNARAMWIAAGVAAAGAVLLAAGSGAWSAGYEKLLTAAQKDLPPASVSFLVDNARAHYVDDVWKVWGVLAVGAAALAMLGTGLLRRTPFWLVAAALLLFDLWRVDYRIISPPSAEVDARLRSSLLTPRADAVREIEDEDDVVRFLKADSSLFRILPVEEISSNRYAGFGIASVGGYNPAKPQLYDEVLQAGLQGNPRFWTAANIKYVVTQRDMGPGFAQPVAGRAAPVIGRKVLDGPMKVYRLEPASPRAWMVGRARAVAGRGALEAYNDSTWDPAAEVLLEAVPVGSLGPQEGSRVTFSGWDMNTMEMDVEARSPGYLVVSELYYPDWKATVDGKAAPILKANGFTRAVRLDAGSHRVAMRFDSPVLRRGLRLSLASAAVVLLLVLVPTVAGALRRARGNA